MSKKDIAIMTFMFIVVSAIITVQNETILNKIEKSKSHNERFEKLIHDSVRMHDFYRKVKLSYEDKKRLMK